MIEREEWTKNNYSLSLLRFGIIIPNENNFSWGRIKVHDKDTETFNNVCLRQSCLLRANSIICRFHKNSTTILIES